MIESSRAFGRELLQGIARFARLHGPWRFYREPGGLEKTLPAIRGWGATGIIMRDSQKNQPLLNLNVPAILVLHNSGQRENYPCIITDGQQIGRMAAEHLIERGYENFAFCGFDDLIFSQERLKSFRQHIEKAGFKVIQYRQPQTKRGRLWEYEQQYLADWLASCPKPLALFACNDDRGLHAIEACKIAGIAVPDEVAILGVDNDELFCTLSDIPLSSVALAVEKAGYDAAKLLDELMSGKTPMAGQPIWVHPTHVAVRQSTDTLALKDPEVIKALQFIRANAANNIQVQDVVQETSLTRRMLEKRFQQILKRSIFQEIRTARIKKSVQMLVDTDMQIADISSQLHFPGIEQFSRYFRQSTGMSPSQYRKKFGFQ